MNPATRTPLRSPAIPALKARWRDLRDVYLQQGDQHGARLINAGLRRLARALRQQKREHRISHGPLSGCFGWMAARQQQETGFGEIYRPIQFDPTTGMTLTGMTAEIFYCPFCGAEVDRE